MDQACITNQGTVGAIGDKDMTDLAMSMDVYQCDDGRGNGCGKLFDDSIVKRMGNLCEYCAEDLPSNEGC